MLTALSVLKQTAERRVGVGQLSLVEHSLCPLDWTTKSNLIHAVEYHYSDARRRRQTAKVRVFAPLGLSPTDELYLWGLLALTLGQHETDGTLTATPHWCLMQLGLLDAGTRRGGRQYQEFSAALQRLSVVKYLSDACYDPSRSEYRKVSFGFLSYSLPAHPKSCRAWTICWDRVFFEMIQATGGGMRFDLERYRSLDAASRRLLLLILKVGYRSGRLPVFDLRHLGVDILGLSPNLAIRDMKVKVQRTLQRLTVAGVIKDPEISRTRSGVFSVAFERGSKLDVAMTRTCQLSVENSPLMDGLLAIGFEIPAAVRLIQRYPQSQVALWTDITQAALERFGNQHFRVSPMAFLVDSLKQAALGLRTPPDWWHAARRQERRIQPPTAEGRKVLSRLVDEVFGSQSPRTSKSPNPESAADLLKRLL